MNQSRQNPKKRPITVRDIAVFAMLGALMFVSKILMEGLPNIHPVGMFIVAFTVVYRKRALIPIYVFVFLIGLFYGFDTWWYPYLYIWTVLWAMTMLIPKNISDNKAKVIYPLVCTLHGLIYGTLYAPAWALIYGLDFKGMIASIPAGLYFDALHGVGNFIFGMLILPLSELLKKLDRKMIQ